ncbi:Chloroperoxidase [Suillus clintonianus]|uniref:Chloroperoxidase n=1 Tax=Suillus clintonianus TaxID=1904413 RepID=UPI001B86EECB|nr:Chloroperoxidase [Suillus clintonianus]KAG2157512.1 Chloroperoxidase [Suillus clintonianus]
MGFSSGVSNFFYDVKIMSWDVILTLLNVVGKKHHIGDVTPEGHPGYGGYWPEFRPPQETDSRCSCPGLNALANHGIISHSGRGISFVELDRHVRATYNISSTLSSFVPHYAARMLKRSYKDDTFDLEELDLHNGIEHDASLLRLDAAFQPNQSTKHVPYIEELLAAASGKDKDGNVVITTKDLSKLLGKRRAVARAVNQEFSLKSFHKLFGCANASLLLSTFGGRVDHLQSFLLDERFPEGWESHVRQPRGLTLVNFNKLALSIEFGVREKDWKQVAQEAAAHHEVTPA